MSELDRLRDRVAELEDAMGLTARVPPELVPRALFPNVRLGRPAILRFIGVLLTRPFGSREAMFLAFYGARPEADQPASAKALDVYASHARQALKQHGVEFLTVRGQGWHLDNANKAKLRAVIDRLNHQQQQAA